MNFSNMIPSHGLQFFLNCFSLSAFPGVQSLRSKLLWRGFPVGSLSLPLNLPQSGLFSPPRTQVLPEICSSADFQRVTAYLRHPPALTWGPPWSAVDLFSMERHRFQGTACFNTVWGICFGTWSTFFSFFCTGLGVHRAVLTYSYSSLFWLLLHSNFYPPHICCSRDTTTVADGLGLGQLWICLGAGLCSLSHKLRPASETFLLTVLFLPDCRGL